MMVNQIKAQNFRLWKRKGNLLVALLLFVLNFMFAYEKAPTVKNVNEILAMVVGDTSLQIIVSLCVAWFVGSEFSERTIQSELKLGYSRASVLFVRFLYSGLLAIFLHIFYVFGACVGAAYRYGFGLSGITPDNIVWIFVVLFQVIAVQSFTIFIVFLIRKALPSMVVATLLSLIGCNVLRNFCMDSKVYTLSCFCLAVNNEKMTLAASVLYAVATLAVVMTATYLLFRKADME